MSDIIITIFVTLVASSGFWTFLNARLEAKRKAESAEVKALKAILFNLIKDECQKVLAKGYITKEEYDDIYFLYQPYHDGLHGNGRAQKYWEEVQKLPLKTS